MCRKSETSYQTPRDEAGERSQKLDPEARKREIERIEAHRALADLADAEWSKKAKVKKWDQVIPHMEVYRYCGLKYVRNVNSTSERICFPQTVK